MTFAIWACKLRLKAWLYVLVLFCLTAYHSQAQIKWDVEKFMPLSEVKPGMKGKGYTVFSGTTVEEFDFEVVSIEYNFYPRLDLIWAKALSENFKHTGVAAGMSGSPMYIDGRLMGALSRGYSSQREKSNLFLVTPIELMVNITKRGMEPNLSYEGTQLFNLGSETVGQGINMLPSFFVNGNSLQPQRPFDAQISHLMESTPRVDSTQLTMPVTLPALTTEAMGIFKPFFEKLNLMPLRTVGGGSPVKNSPVENGQTVGTEMARGDFSAFGYGTITHVEGTQLLAYGHGMFQEGNVNIPMSGGYVHLVFPSRSRSFKQASPTQPIGTLVQDHEATIAGIIGKHPSYIPVNVNVATSYGEQHNMYYEVIRHKGMSPIFVGMGAWFILDTLEFWGNDYTLNVEATINLKEQPVLTSRELVYKNVYSSSGSPGFRAMQTLMMPVMQLTSNPYTKVQVEDISLDVKIEDKRRTATIDSLRVDKLRYRPGETVEVELMLRPYLETPIMQTGTITIPKDASEGQIMLIATNASFHEAWQRSRAPLNFRPKNINQLVELLQRGENNAEIILELFVPQPGLTVQGKEFSNLPLSVMSVMNTAKQVGESGYTMGTTLHLDKVSTDYVIFGSGFIRFVVDRNAQ